jgi:microcystin-dependent protein
MNDSIDDMLFAIQQQNLVYNYNFLYYSNKETVASLVTLNHPDGWMYEDSGANGEVSFDEGTMSCLIQKSSDDSIMTFTQVISEFPRWQETVPGKKVSALAVIQNPSSASTDFELTFSINDGISTSSKTIPFKSGDRKEISLELNVALGATKLEVNIECSTKKAIIYVNKIYANIGEIALDTLPCIVNGIIGERKQYIATENPPAEELSLCNAPIALTKDQTRLNSVLNGRFGKDGNGYSMLLDMRGYFSRAWDNGSTIDPNATDRTIPGKGTLTGDHVSTFEQDDFLKHDHGLDFTVSTAQSTTGGTGPNTNLVSSPASKTNEEANGKETRPKNIYELYTIKWA